MCVPSRKFNGMRSPRSSEVFGSLPTYGDLFVIPGSSEGTILNKKTVHDKKVRIALVTTRGENAEKAYLFITNFDREHFSNKVEKGEVRNFKKERCRAVLTHNIRNKSTCSTH